MKKRMQWALLVLVGIAFGIAIGSTGCASTGTSKPQAPLEDTGVPVDPPPGCVDLRKRGGAC